AFSSERADRSERGSNTTYMVADFMPLYTLRLQVDRAVQTSLVATKASALGRYKDGVNGRVGATARIPNISRPRETEAEAVLLLPRDRRGAFERHGPDHAERRSLRWRSGRHPRGRPHRRLRPESQCDLSRAGGGRTKYRCAAAGGSALSGIGRSGRGGPRAAQPD